MKINCFALFIFVSFAIQAQISSDTLKSVNGVGVGVLGAWFFYEEPIGRLLTIQTEAGYEKILIGERGNMDYKYSPTIHVETKYLYNLMTRQKNGKNTTYLASDFFSFEIGYAPNFFSETASEGFFKDHRLSIASKYGIRRILLRRIALDLGMGVRKFWTKNINQVEPAIDLRLSYVFH